MTSRLNMYNHTQHSASAQLCGGLALSSAQSVLVKIVKPCMNPTIKNDVCFQRSAGLVNRRL